MSNEQSRKEYFPNGIERYLSKPEESNGGKDDTSHQNGHEIESVINSSPSPSASHQTQGEQAKVGEPGDELQHPDQHPGDVWPD